MSTNDLVQKSRARASRAGERAHASVVEPKRYVPTRQPPGFVAASFGVTPSSWNMNV